MKKAINYLLTKWDEATLFITNPYVIPHNNIAEQYFRYLKLGEKNWMFCASELGAETLCVLYPLIYSAKMLNINPMYYLMDLLTLIDQKGYKADDLIPTKWKESREKIVIAEHRISFRS
jgi:transposase